MPPSATSTTPKRGAPTEPTFWQRYSPSGECPLSVAGSVFVHIGFFVLLVVLAYFGFNLFGAEATDFAKPPQMDAVEIEGGGGRPEGVAQGKGLDGSGPSMKRESPGLGAGNPRTGDFQPKDFKYKDVGPKDFDKVGTEPNPPIASDGDVWAKLDDEQKRGKKMMENGDLQTQSGAGDGTKGGASPLGKGGGTGGGIGTGSGDKKGPGQGKSPNGVVFNDQRRREFRWKIHASESGDVHLKKLQALQVVLLVPAAGKPGYMLRYDLSKAALAPDLVRAEDDSKKVRWKNDNRNEMMGLASVLKLRQVPPFTVIYLPSAMEADMAREELAYEGRLESDIQMTEWDVRERDGIYENRPYILRQVLKPGVK
jgi:hypothetical protein